MLWTPAILIFESGGVERFRIEGYLPNDEFRAHLELSLARIAFMHKQWADAERRYAEIVARLPDTVAAAEAQYWAGVAKYKGANDHTALGRTAAAFKTRYTDSVWAKKASVWSG